jgi:hypothetical protein
MTRWIAFDPETTSLLRSNLAQGARIETLRRGPVDYALARAGAVITVLPAPEDGGLGIAVFRPARHSAIQAPATVTTNAPAKPLPAATPPASAAQPAIAPPLSKVARPAPAKPHAPPTAAAQPTVNRAGTRASGFLGLSDEPVFEEAEVVEEKKGWWRKLWEE